MFGQLGFFYAFGGKGVEDPIPRDRYIAETHRLLGVLDKRLEGRDWVCGSYSIADMAIGPWLNALNHYEAHEAVGYDDFENVDAYFDRFFDRPAAQRAQNIPPRKG